MFVQNRPVHNRPLVSKQTTFITEPFVTDPFITDHVHNPPHSYNRPLLKVVMDTPVMNGSVMNVVRFEWSVMSRSVLKGEPDWTADSFFGSFQWMSYSWVNQCRFQHSQSQCRRRSRIISGLEENLFIKPHSYCRINVMSYHSRAKKVCALSGEHTGLKSGVTDERAEGRTATTGKLNFKTGPSLSLYLCFSIPFWVQWVIAFFVFRSAFPVI